MCDLISIIVPIYNVEEYLSSCIDSICRQTYSNLEIILVDDGSPDLCGQICDEYAKRDSRICVIHKENGGLSDARNAGLYASRGKYVLFIDSDDVISPHMIERLYLSILETGAEIAACEYTEFENEDEIPAYTEAGMRVFDGKELTSSLYKGKFSKIGFIACNKMYAKDLLINNDIAYPKGKLHEDTYTTYKSLYLAKQVVLLELPMYFYRMRNGSITKSKTTLKKCRDGIEGDFSCVEYFEKHNDKEMMTAALAVFYRSTIKMYIQVKKEHNDECLRLVKEKYAEVWKQYQFFGNMLKRIIFSLFRFFPDFIAWIYLGRKQQCVNLRKNNGI